MKYLLDNHSVSKELLVKMSGANNFYILRDVIDENTSLQGRESEIRRSGIVVVEMTIEILRKLKDVLAKHAYNLKLINLYTGKGATDVLMIAYILFEKKTQELF